MNKGDYFYHVWVDDWKVWTRFHQCDQYRPIEGFITTVDGQVVGLHEAWGLTEKDAKAKLLKSYRDKANMVLDSILSGNPGEEYVVYQEKVLDSILSGK